MIEDLESDVITRLLVKKFEESCHALLEEQSEESSDDESPRESLKNDTLQESFDSPKQGWTLLQNLKIFEAFLRMDMMLEHLKHLRQSILLCL